MRIVAISLLLAAHYAQANAIEVSLKPRGYLGRDLPAVQLEILQSIAGFELKLKRNDGKDLLVRGGGKPGTVKTIELAQPEGKFSYTGQLRVTLPTGEVASMPLNFEAELWGALRISLEKKDLDLERRKLRFSLSRPAAKAHITVIMDTGQTVLDSEVLFRGAAPDTPLEITWPQANGRVIKINLEAYDTSDFHTGVELSPWQIEIPHEEVNFETGKWEIRESERPKLEKSLKAIVEAIQHYGTLAKLRFYIAGHTDTQGSTESNRILSLNRARSIGLYFRNRGITIPIYYEGFGEEALLVATPDETNEPRNRRAEYIVTIDEPTLKQTPFPPAWKKL